VGFVRQLLAIPRLYKSVQGLAKATTLAYS